MLKSDGDVSNALGVGGLGILNGAEEPIGRVSHESSLVGDGDG